jgi:hypothetical protein
VHCSLITTSFASDYTKTDKVFAVLHMQKMHTKFPYVANTTGLRTFTHPDYCSLVPPLVSKVNARSVLPIAVLHVAYQFHKENTVRHTSNTNHLYCSLVSPLVSKVNPRSVLPIAVLHVAYQQQQAKYRTDI